ncbi:MAG: xylulokinase [Verrucomicrobiota bacterium]|jgi:xylulokinase
MLCLGIDSGTTATKALVFDFDARKLLTLAQQPHNFVEGLPHGHIEQTPQVWIDAAKRAIEECLGQLGDRKREITAIGVSAQQHGLVVLDAKNEPIRPVKLWCDTSTAAQAEELNKALGGVERLIERTGNAMVSGYTAPKLLWLKQKEPRNFSRIRTVLLPHDYINFWLTGERQMEHGDASGTGLLDVRERKWCEPLLEYIDPDMASKLPPLRSSTRPAGLLRDTLRKEWNLTGEILVSAGSGDNMMAAIGTGNIKKGIVTVSLGSSGTAYSFTDKPISDGKGEIALFCDATERWLLLACTMNVAVAIEQVRKLFQWDVPTLETNVSSAPAGAHGLLFLPYLQGERLPNLPGGSGVLHGLSLENMRAPEIARAVVEGVTMGLAYGMKRLLDLGIEPAEVRLTGGGSRSAVWRRIATDIFGYPTIALKIAEAAAFGAAIHAAWSYSLVKGKPVSLENLVRDAVKTDRKTRLEPRRETASFYAELRLRQSDLTRKLSSSGYL